MEPGIERILPWLRLGVRGGEGESAVSVLARFGEYWVRKVGLYYGPDAGNGPSPHFALLGPTGVDWGHVGPRYQVVQPRQIAEAWDRYLGWPILALGAHRGGRRFFIVSQSDPIGVKGRDAAHPDEVLHVRVVVTDMTGRGSITGRDEAWRVVCTNGMVARQGLRNYFRILHLGNVQGSINRAFAAIADTANARREALAGGLERAARVAMPDDALRAGLAAVYPVPAAADADGETSSALRERRDRELGARQAALDARFQVWGLFREARATGADAPQFAGTGYGFVQAVAEREQHLSPARGELALAGDVLFGERQRRVERAWNFVAALKEG